MFNNDYLPNKIFNNGQSKGQTIYIVYDRKHKYRGGHKHKRTDWKKVQIMGKNPQWDLNVKRRKTKQGTTKTGIAVEYQTEVKTRSGGTTTRDVRKIIELPKGAENVRVRKTNPKGLPSVFGGMSQ